MSCNLEVGRGKCVNLTTKLFSRFLQPPLDPFARLGAKRPQWKAGLVVRMLTRGETEKSELFPITTAPLAEEQVNVQADSLPKPQPPVKRRRLQMRRLFAIGRNLTQTSQKVSPQFCKPVHCNFDCTVPPWAGLPVD